MSTKQNTCGLPVRVRRAWGLLSLGAVLLAGCASEVPLPKGTSKGYTSARLVRTGAPVDTEGPEGSAEVNKTVQEAIAAQFRANGMPFGAGNADLIVAYMLIRQDVAMTTINRNYFGHGRDAEAIMEEAHTRGVLKNKRPDQFEAGAIVIDILDAQTNKLVYRSYSKRDLIENVTEETRRRRINEAVAEALGPFFR